MLSAHRRPWVCGGRTTPIAPAYQPEERATLTAKLSAAVAEGDAVVHVAIVHSAPNQLGLITSDLSRRPRSACPLLPAVCKPPYTPFRKHRLAAP